MKEVIDLNSDSNQQDKVIEIPKQKIKAKKQQTLCLKSKSKNWITLFQESTNKNWKIDERFRNISPFFEEMKEEINHLEDSIFTIHIYGNLVIDNQIIKIISVFYQLHGFDVESIHIGKIKMEGYQKSIDQISMQFIQTYLKKESQQFLKNLFNICEYFKLNHLKELISTYIASKHFYKFNNNTMKKQIQENYAFYSREEDILIHKNMQRYARQLSLDLLDKLKQKHNQQYGT